MRRSVVSLLCVLALLLTTVSGVVFAQSSNELVVYSTIFAGYAEAMKREFEARNPGVTVHVINPGGTEAMLARLMAERNNPRADVMHSGGSTEYTFAKAQGLLAPVDLGDIGIPDKLQLGDSFLPTHDEEGYYYSWAVLFSGIMVNTDRMQRLGLPMPTSYADLANPIYKGHIISPNPLRSSTAVTNVLTVHQAYDRDEAWELWDKINDNIGFYVDSTSNTYTLVAHGEYPIAIVVNRPVYEVAGARLAGGVHHPVRRHDGARQHDGDGKRRAQSGAGEKVHRVHFERGNAAHRRGVFVLAHSSRRAA